MSLQQQPPFAEATKDIGFLSWLTQFVQNFNGIFVPPPLHSNSTGTQYQLAIDANYFYYCYLPNTWARIAKTPGAW